MSAFFIESRPLLHQIHVAHEEQAGPEDVGGRRRGAHRQNIRSGTMRTSPALSVMSSLTLGSFMMSLRSTLSSVFLSPSLRISVARLGAANLVKPPASVTSFNRVSASGCG